MGGFVKERDMGRAFLDSVRTCVESYLVPICCAIDLVACVAPPTVTQRRFNDVYLDLTCRRSRTQFVTIWIPSNNPNRNDMDRSIFYLELVCTQSKIHFVTIWISCPVVQIVTKWVFFSNLLGFSLKIYFVTIWIAVAGGGIGAVDHPPRPLLWWRASSQAGTHWTSNLIRGHPKVPFDATWIPVRNIYIFGSPEDFE